MVVRRVKLCLPTPPSCIMSYFNCTFKKPNFINLPLFHSEFCGSSRLILAVVCRLRSARTRNLKSWNKIALKKHHDRQAVTMVFTYLWMYLQSLFPVQVSQCYILIWIKCKNRFTASLFLCSSVLHVFSSQKQTSFEWRSVHQSTERPARHRLDLSHFLRWWVSWCYKPNLLWNIPCNVHDVCFLILLISLHKCLVKKIHASQFISMSCQQN